MFFEDHFLNWWDTKSQTLHPGIPKIIVRHSLWRHSKSKQHWCSTKARHIQESKRTPKRGCPWESWVGPKDPQGGCPEGRLACPKITHCRLSFLHFFGITMGTTHSGAADSIFNCILRHWEKFNPVNLKKKCFVFFCNTAWLQSKLGD